MASDDQQHVYTCSNIDDSDMLDFSFLFADNEYDQSTLPPPIIDDQQEVYTSSNGIVGNDDDDCFDLSILEKIFAGDNYDDDRSTLPPPIINNTNGIVGNDDDCFDLSNILEKIFPDDDYNQSPTITNSDMITSDHQQEPIVLQETNNYSMPCLNVVYPDPPAEEIVVDSNINKRKRVQEEEEEVVSPRRQCIFKAAPETLENRPSHDLFHQETAHTGSITPSSSPRSSSYAAIQPYTVNNNVSHVDVSDYHLVGSLGSKTMGGDPLMKKPINFIGSKRQPPNPWTVEEHVRFLMGIAHGYRGDWKTVSRVFVRTRTVKQVTSHAQKHFLHQDKIANPSMRRRRSKSIYDIASLSQVEVSKVADALRYVRSPLDQTRDH